MCKIAYLPSFLFFFYILISSLIFIIQNKQLINRIVSNLWSRLASDSGEIENVVNEIGVEKHFRLLFLLDR